MHYWIETYIFLSKPVCSIIVPWLESAAYIQRNYLIICKQVCVNTIFVQEWIFDILALQWIRCIFDIHLYQSYLVLSVVAIYWNIVLCVPMCVFCSITVTWNWNCWTKLASFHGHVKGSASCSHVVHVLAKLTLFMKYEVLNNLWQLHCLGYKAVM